jgi:hypothetical protein
MTSLLERFTGPAGDLEEPRVTNPSPFTLPRGVPWWAGVYGLDPALPVEDWALAAQCTAMACAACVYGLGAGYRAKLITRKGAPAAQWLDWLLEAAGPEDATRRRLALRLICERTQADDADAILEDARHLHAACSPGARLR